MSESRNPPAVPPQQPDRTGAGAPAPSSETDAEGQWRAAFDSLTDGLLIFDARHFVVRANASALRLIGLPAERVIGAKCCALFVQSGWLPDETLYKQMLSSGVHAEREFFSPKRNAWYHSVIDPIRDAAGRRNGSIHRVTDITERKRAEEVLRAERERVAGIIDAVFEGVIIYSPIRDAEGKITDFRTEFANDAACAAMKLPRERFLAGTFLDRHPYARDTEIFHSFVAVQETGIPRALESATFHVDIGGERVRRVLDVRMARPGANLVVAWRDVTERRRIEERLRENEALLEGVFESITDPVVVLDRTLTVARVNRAVERFFPEGTPLIGKKCYEALHAGPGPCENCPAGRTLETGEVTRHERMMTLPDGTQRRMDVVAYPLRSGPRGEIVGVVESARDVTEERRAQEELAESERRYRASMLDPIGIYSAVRDGEGRIVDFRIEQVNEAACAANRRSREEQVGHRLCEVIPGIRTSGFFEHMVRTVESGAPLILDGWRYEGLVDDAAASLVLDVRAAKLGDGIVVSWRDVTARLAAEASLRESEERFRLLFDQAGESIILADPETGRFVAFNRKAYEDLGYTRAEFETLTPAEIDADETPADRARRVRRILKEGADDFTTRHRTRSGEVRDVHVSARVVYLGGRQYVQALWRDITERKRLEEKLQALTLVDELTGLYNRRGFVTLAEQQVKVAARSRRDLYLLFADLDNLKWTNDRHGHRAGDALLRDTARLFKATFRESDIIGRIGGDEFVVLMAETGNATPEQLTTRLRAGIEKRNRRAEGAPLSLSVGVARQAGDAPGTLDALMRRADALMYEEKRRKRAEARAGNGHAPDAPPPPGPAAGD